MASRLLPQGVQSRVCIAINVLGIGTGRAVSATSLISMTREWRHNLNAIGAQVWQLPCCADARQTPQNYRQRFSLIYDSVPLKRCRRPGAFNHAQVHTMPGMRLKAGLVRARSDRTLHEPSHRRRHAHYETGCAQGICLHTSPCHDASQMLMVQQTTCRAASCAAREQVGTRSFERQAKSTTRRTYKLPANRSVAHRPT